jgi:type IV secretory pathway TrbD component
MRVLILYESRRGFTLTVARALRDELRALGTEATTAPLRTVDAGTLAAADALVVGTWVKGLVIVGVGPAHGTQEAIDALPELEGRPTVVYCTCKIAPRGTLDLLSEWLDRKGADVRGRAVFKRDKSLATAPAVAAGIVEALQPTA